MTTTGVMPANGNPVSFFPASVPKTFLLVESEPIKKIINILRTWVDECPTELEVTLGTPQHQAWTLYWKKKCYEPYDESQVQFLQNILFSLSKRVQGAGVSSEAYCNEVIGLSRWFLGDLKCHDLLDDLPECPRVLGAAEGRVEGGICLRWAVDANRQNPLFYQSASRGKLDIIKYYVEELKIPVGQADTAVQTPIFYAARDGNLEAIQYLVAIGGANMNHADGNKQTALFYAAKNLQLEAVKLMIELGADVNQRDVQKKTAVQWTDDQKIKTIVQRAQRQQSDKVKARQQQKRVNPTGRPGPSPAGKRRRFALTLSAPEHIRWDANEALPIVYDSMSQEQLWPSVSAFSAQHPGKGPIPFRTTTVLPLIPMASELENLERQLPAVTIWARDWPVWGTLPGELEDKVEVMANDFASGYSQAEMIEIESKEGSQKGEEEIIRNDAQKLTERHPHLVSLRQLPPKLAAHLAVTLAPYRSHWLAELKKLVHVLLQSDTEHWFSRPVDPVQDRCTDYNSVISTPMDFGTIKKKLTDGKYVFIYEVLTDARLVFENCFKYNRDPTNAVNIKGKALHGEWSILLESRFIETAWIQAEKEMVHYVLDLRGLDDLAPNFV